MNIGEGEKLQGRSSGRGEAYTGAASWRDCGTVTRCGCAGEVMR